MLMIGKTATRIKERFSRRAAAGRKASTVTRFEVIDEHGRSYSANPARIELSYQDDGRTLKVFVDRLAECRVPPYGWRCTRGAGHDGPCAAVRAAAPGWKR